MKGAMQLKMEDDFLLLPEWNETPNINNIHDLVKIEVKLMNKKVGNWRN